VTDEKVAPLPDVNAASNVLRSLPTAPIFAASESAL